MSIKNILGEKTFISIYITDDKEMKKLNKEYLNRDYTTDVLSFEIKDNQPDGTFYLGDVVVNKDQAKRQAKDYDNDLEEEISELVGHGVLHLLGIHHEGDGIPASGISDKNKKAIEEVEGKLVKEKDLKKGKKTR
jgi:probable rRNA maturation factor